VYRKSHSHVIKKTLRALFNVHLSLTGWRLTLVWVDQKESFYCGLDDCSFELGMFAMRSWLITDVTADANITRYVCQKVKCQCIPERMLCGEDGSIGIPCSKTSRANTQISVIS